RETEAHRRFLPRCVQDRYPVTATPATIRYFEVFSAGGPAPFTVNPTRRTRSANRGSERSGSTHGLTRSVSSQLVRSSYALSMQAKASSLSPRATKIIPIAHAEINWVFDNSFTWAKVCLASVSLPAHA